jgi:hypothetical protein
VLFHFIVDWDNLSLPVIERRSEIIMHLVLCAGLQQNIKIIVGWAREPDEIFFFFLEDKIFLVVSEFDKSAFQRLNRRNRFEFFKRSATPENDKKKILNDVFV